MRNQGIMDKLHKGILAGGMICILGSTMLLGGSSVFADEAQPQKQVQSQNMLPKHNDHCEMLRTLLEKLVKDSVIKQDQLDKVIAFVQKKDAERKAEFEKMKNLSPEEWQKLEADKKKERPDIFADLVKEGILTQQQVDAIKKELPKPDFHSDFDGHGPGHFPGMMQNGHFNPMMDKAHPGPGMPKEVVEGLLYKSVKDGVIKQDQADKLLAFMQEKEEERKAEFDKMQKSAPEKGQKPPVDKTKERPDILADAVKAGIINQKQADALAKVFPKFDDKGPFNPADKGGFCPQQSEPMMQKGHPGHMMQKGLFKDIIDKAVTNKIIKQDQADKMTAFLQKKEEEKKAEFEKMKNLSPEEWKKLKGDKKKDHQDMLAEIVKAGIITQNQADQIAKLLPQPPAFPNDKQK